MLHAGEAVALIYESYSSSIYHRTAGPHGSPVVIKVSNTAQNDPRHLIRLKNEYEFTKNLAVEGVRKAIAMTRMGGKPALVMEFVAGQTLRQAFVKRRRPLADFLQAAIQIAGILAEVHQQHIIHMDINSDNILVNPETNQIRLIDFGLASRLDSQEKFLGNPERLPWTLAYISPEQTGRMNRPVDYRTDLYSLGVTFYEMLTGRLPFEGDDPLALVHAHMARAPLPVTALNPGVPPGVSRIVMKLLAKNAEDRYQSALGLKADMERCLACLEDPKNLEGPVDFDFPLGLEDHSGQFHLSKKLYGRSAERATLLAAFDRAAAGGRELLLVTGHAGVGKSVLVAEIHKSVTRERGYFISGKFDQYQQSRPYAAFTQAFEEFAGLLLSESRPVLKQWRDRILSAVDGNGAVLTEVMPALEQIIGKQPEVSKLGGTENRNRFLLTFQTFLKAISTGGHPLVVFIDDWQWADPASLGLLKALLTGGKIGHLLLIGAYRDSEVDHAHPFMTALRDIAEAGIPTPTILLENLKPEDVHLFVQESLLVSAAGSRVLAELVYKKTRGNAFFTHQFLRALYEEGWLCFDFRTRRWTWEIAQIEARNMADNVVELMAGKLKKLPPETARLLQLAACIGNEFDLCTLVLIGQVSEPAALELLSEALDEGLLLPMDSYYKLPETAVHACFSFLHDRVQQAAYSQIPPLERQRVHLRIGRLLSASTSEMDLGRRIFSIVQHYNHAGDLITDPAEKLKAAELNMKAAALAYRAAAFRPAQDYLETALSLMPSDAWASRYDMMLELHSQLSTVLCLTGGLVQLERILLTTGAHARCTADTARVKQAKLQSLLNSGDNSGAIELGINFIEAMGVPVNRNPSAEEASRYLHETAEWLTEERIEHLARLPEACMEVRLVLEVASLLEGPLPNKNMHLYSVFISRITRLCIERGLTPWALLTLMIFAAQLSSRLHDIPKARRLAAAAMKLLETRYPSDSLLSAFGMMIGGFLRHRHDHLKSTLPLLDDGVQKGLSSGTFHFAGYCAWWQPWHLLFAAAPLAEVEAACRQAEDTCRKIQMERTQARCRLVRQVVLNLQGRSAVPHDLTGEAYDERKMLPLAFELDDLGEAFRIHFYKAWLHYLFGRPQRAVQLFKEAETHLLHVAGHYLIPLFYFYDALAHAALADSRGPDGLSKVLQRMDRNLAQLEVWVRFAPMNHQHKKDLMEAEKARLEGRWRDAAELYEKAVKGAGDNDFLNDEALACELCGKFWAERGNRETAGFFLGKALDAYREWGAGAKADRLATALDPGLIRNRDVSPEPEREPPAPRPSAGSWLDVKSLMKAGQTLSQTVRLSDLLAEMSRIVLENAGAQKVLILHREEGMWFIVASGQVGDPAVETGLRMPVSETANLSLGVFNYVVNSGKAVVLENACRDSQFGAETYLNEHEVKSVLCLPIYHKGRLDLVIYLENNLTEGAFTEKRIEFLQLLSGHMAISLENASIYENLRTSIAERKRVEQTLKEREERLRLALEGTMDGIWDWNFQTGEAYFSPRTYTMLGYEPDEFPACYESWRRLIHPDDVEQCERAVLRGIEEQSKFAVEFRFKAKNGEWRWILGRGKVAEADPSGRVLRVAGSHTDITERKRVEQALREANLVVENSPAVLFRWRAAEGWPVELVSKNVTRFGFTPEEILSGAVRYSSMVHPDDLNRVASEVQQYSEAGADHFSQEYRLVARDGAVRWVEDHTVTERDSSGRITHYQGVVLDITERKRTEEALHELSKLQTVILDNSTVGIALVRNRVFEWTNQTMTELFGIPQKQLQGAPTRIVYPDDETYERMDAEALPLLAQGKKATLDMELRRGDGSLFWCRLEGKALDASHPREGVIWIGADITERKRTEEALEKRIVALTRPLDSDRGLAFEDLFNLSDLQHLQDLFADAFGVAALMTRPDGRPITVPSNFSGFCSKMIRGNPKGAENCRRSDAELGRHNPSGPVIQNCLSAGLCNAGASITVGGRHVANWLIGQVRNESQNEEAITQYARAIGADEAEYLAAYRSVPVMPEEQFERIARLLFAVSSQISTSAYQNIQQARFIAERKQAEDTLRKYERIVATSQDIIALVSRDYVYEAVNDSLLTVHDKTREEIVGKTMRDLYGEKVFREMIQPRFEQTLSGRTVHYRTAFDYAGIGHRIMEVAYFPVFDEKGKVTGVVLNARDVTETRKLEEQLMQSQKIESLGTLAGGVAHEINNPINGIMNYAQLILDRAGSEGSAGEFAREILHETRRVATIVRNLLTFARYEKQSHSPARMADIVSAVLSLIQTVMRHDQIAMEISVPEDLPSFKCRSQQIQQVLMNLMTNARDALNERYPGYYSPQKILRLASEVVVKEDGRRYIRTTVEDTGAGIPPEIRDRIFDPFFTTKPKETGTGLGLSISYGIVRDHGGELSVESKLNEYTRVYVDLPVDNGWTVGGKQRNADG